MSRITLDLISQELAPLNWKVISNEYKNLSTEMEFECSEGHKVFTTWDKLRKHIECPICKKNTLKENKPIIIEKKKGTIRILALDQASHKTGFAILDNQKLIRYGTYESHGEDEIARFHDLKNWLISMIDGLKPDLIGVEGIQFQTNVNMGVTTFQTLARLQGIILETIYEYNIPYKVCPTNTWRGHIGVKGKSRSDKKRSMQLLVKDWFDITVSDDEADAIGIGKYCADTFKSQVELVSWE